MAGSGAAGLTAALSAAQRGAHVTLCESTGVLGGTTALSGCVAWMPVNRWMRAEGVNDSFDDAMAYLDSLSLGDIDRPLIEVFVREGAATAEWIEETTPVRWQSVPYPDYHAELPGGKEGHRSIEPAPMVVPTRVSSSIRNAPNVVAPVTYRELTTRLPSREVFTDRVARNVLTMGRAFIAGMVMALEELDVEIRVNAAVRERPDGSALILASGGFERDAALVRAFLRGPMDAPIGAPGANGDALRLAMRAGAALGNMSEAWWGPALSVPGETLDGEPFHRLVLTERARANCYVVDSRGRRFMNEAQNYNDVGRAMQGFDATSFSFPAARSWLIFDATYRRANHLGPLRRDDPDPPWLRRADTIDELATLIGTPELATSHVRFNEHAAVGGDPDFRRGEQPYDRFVGAPPAPVVDAPFYAVALRSGCLGTKGGPRTDDCGRVLDLDGRPIPDLFAVGNAAASPLGLAYPGAGGTIGPMLVFARRAGEAAAS